MAAETIDTTPWEELEKIIDSGNVEHLEAFLYLLAPGDTADTITKVYDKVYDKDFTITARFG